MTVQKLDSVAIGWPITRLGVSFFPVYVAANELPAITTGKESGLIVNELDQASVQSLRVRNPSDKPVLVTEGEHFLGGKQNRAVNVTVLVPAETELEIPVSCLERGRWGQRRAWTRDEVYAGPRIRARKSEGVTASMRSHGSRRGDQSAVWSEVDEMLERVAVHSTTAAAADARQAAHRRRPSLARAVENLVARGPLPGQCGIVIVHGRWVTGMDLFGAPHLLAAHWGALIRSHFLESPAAEGNPSASQVLRFVRRFALHLAKAEPGVGLGMEHRVSDDRLAGHCLTLNGVIVHAAFFTRGPER